MVASTRVDGVHVVERLFDEVVKFYVIQVAEVLTEDGFGVFHFFNKR